MLWIFIKLYYVFRKEKLIMAFRRACCVRKKSMFINVCKVAKLTIHKPLSSLQREILKTKTLIFNNWSLVTNNNTKKQMCFSLYMKSPCLCLKKNRHGHTKREAAAAMTATAAWPDFKRVVAAGWWRMWWYLRNLESVKRNKEIRAQIWREMQRILF